MLFEDELAKGSVDFDLFPERADAGLPASTGGIWQVVHASTALQRNANPLLMLFARAITDT